MSSNSPIRSHNPRTRNDKKRDTTNVISNISENSDNGGKSKLSNTNYETNSVTSSKTNQFQWQQVPNQDKKSRIENHSLTPSKLPQSHNMRSSSQRKPIQVVARIKPSSTENRSIQVTSPQSLTLFASPHTGEERKYRFPYIFPESTSQKLIYQSISPALMETAWSGCNCSIFTYGEQESGKTYTLYGSLTGLSKRNNTFSKDYNFQNSSNHSIEENNSFQTSSYEKKDDAGIVPRFLNDLFTTIQRKKQIRRAKGFVDIEDDSNQHERYKVIISMVEIRNEKVFDLLNPTNPENDKPSGLKIREHPKFGPYAPSLSLFDVRDDKEVLRMVKKALKSSTKGHTILQVILTQTKFDWKKKEAATDVVSRINLVDLGAPERLDSNTEYKKQKVQEGTSINLTLATLGLVITKLSEQSSVESPLSNNSPLKNLQTQSFVPYRDSAITWLLRESLGGNSFTMILACIDPQEKHSIQTWSTLRFASRASRVTNRLKVNIYTNETILQELQKEVEVLQKKLKIFNGTNEEYMQMKEELEDVKFLSTTLKMTPQERIVSFEAIREATVRKHITAVSVKDVMNHFTPKQNEFPYLVALNPQTNVDKLLYVLSSVDISIGSSLENDIIVKCNGVAPNHAKISLSSNMEICTITPQREFSVFVNGSRINDTVILNIYDRVILGDFGFRYYPKPSLVNKAIQNQVVEPSLMDWEESKKEYMQRRMEDLEKELAKILPLENKKEKISRKIEEKKLLHNELTSQIEELEKQRYQKIEYIEGLEAQNSGIWTWCCWVWCCPLMCCSRRRRNEINPDKSRLNFDTLLGKREPCIVTGEDSSRTNLKNSSDTVSDEKLVITDFEVTK